jgi:dihydroflavonol-4-reductase
LIYITGATGFIGSRVARTLLQRGERVRCLVRSRARSAELERLGAELVEGDVADTAAHERGLAGATGAIHLAAIYQIGIVDAQAMERTNVEGTRAFLAAVKNAGTPRAVYTSTTVALGANAADVEPRDAYPPPYHSVYHRTKAQAHQLARAAQREGLPLIIVCPSFVYGPGDEGPAGHFIDDLLARRMPALLSAPSWFSYVHVDDVAQGIVAALDRGTPGEVYLLTGEETDMNDFAGRVARMGGVKPPVLRLPVFLIKATTPLLDFISRATGIRFPITAEAVKTTAVDRWLHSHARATRDLGYNPRSLNEGLSYLKP